VPLTIQQLARMEWEKAIMQAMECCSKQLNRESLANHGWPKADIMAHSYYFFLEGEEKPSRPMPISVATKVEATREDMSRGIRNLLEDIVDQLEGDERWRYFMLRMEMRVEDKTRVSFSLAALK
jgi:hypothetical protein